MALTIQRPLVIAPDRAPLPYGLFTQLTFRPEGDRRWVLGAEWETEPCDTVATNVYDCAPTTLEVPTESNGSGPVGEASSFNIVSVVKCSPVGFSPDTANDRALSTLLRGEERAVERALWSGTVDLSPVLTGADTVAVPAGTYDLAEGLSQLEWAVAQSGSLGIIHVGTALGSLLASARMIEAKGTQMFTRLGTPVVVGAGYDQGATYPTTFTAVATGPAVAYRSETFSPNDLPSDLFDRGRNDLYGSAMRNYTIGFDACLTPTTISITL